VSPEGSQVIIAAIFVVTACITPILFRSIYRMLKKKLDRSSTIYGKLHCLNNR
jgi:ABC-type antimicrobial peptide transport system permease subunit